MRYNSRNSPDFTGDEKELSIIALAGYTLVVLHEKFLK